MDSDESREEAPLTVRRVGIDDDVDDGVFVVGVAEHSDGTGESLVFSMLHEFSDVDRELGQDTYSVSVASGATTYGGVEDTSFRDDRTLSITFSATAQEELGINCRTVVIDLDVGERERLELESGLRRIGLLQSEVGP